jgi:hypothetical protein
MSVHACVLSARRTNISQRLCALPGKELVLISPVPQAVMGCFA